MCGYEFVDVEEFKKSDTATQKLIYNKQGGAIVPIDRKRNASDSAVCPTCIVICDAAVDDFMNEYGDLVKMYQKRIKQDIKLQNAKTKTVKAKILLED